MKSTDLRIGNLALNRKGKIVTVDIYNLKLLNDWGISKYSRTPPLRPVPLTEDILLRFGLPKINGYGFKLKIGNIVMIDNEYWFRSASFDIKLTSVHQLQNLINALTGEELILQ